MRARFTAAALFACLCVTSAAQAAEYNRVNTTASKISFIYKQFGNQVYGTFGKFDATLQFDSDVVIEYSGPADTLRALEHLPNPLYKANQ